MSKSSLKLRASAWARGVDEPYVLSFVGWGPLHMTRLRPSLQ